jgi:hypothetical protein
MSAANAKVENAPVYKNTKQRVSAQEKSLRIGLMVCIKVTLPNAQG